MAIKFCGIWLLLNIRYTIDCLCNNAPRTRQCSIITSTVSIHNNNNDFGKFYIFNFNDSLNQNCSMVKSNLISEILSANETKITLTLSSFTFTFANILLLSCETRFPFCVHRAHYCGSIPPWPKGWTTFNWNVKIPLPRKMNLRNDYLFFSPTELLIKLTSLFCVW